MKPLLRILAPLALALSAHGEARFDLILPTGLGLPGAASSASVPFGTLVNTGTEPLYMNRSEEQRHSSRTDQLWAPFGISLRYPSDDHFALLPGMAIGGWSPELLALLGPGETWGPSNWPLQFGRGPTTSVAGTIRCEVALQGSTLLADSVEREARFELRVRPIAGSVPVTRGAQRIRCTVAAPMIEEVDLGCETLIIGPSSSSSAATPAT